MMTLHVTERTGKDGVLHLHLPLGKPEKSFDVVLGVQPKGSVDSAAAKGWPNGYFELAGSIVDSTFDRPPQGAMLEPVDL